MSTLGRLWTRLVTVLTVTTFAVLIPTYAWAADSGAIDLARKIKGRSVASGLGFGLLCCLLVVAAVVVLIIFLVRRGRRR